jgi:hypothetical protein
MAAAGKHLNAVVKLIEHGANIEDRGALRSVAILLQEY